MDKLFTPELIEWANAVIKKCKPISEDYYLDYYAFQKPCNLKFKTLILGLNPYSNFSGPFKKVDSTIESFLTSENLLNGNQEWKGHQKKSKIFSQLLKMKMIDDLDLEFNYMNYVYFPSKNFEDLQKLKEVDIISICKNLTLQFLQILKPELIILLGTSTGIDQFVKESENIVLGSESKRLLVKGKIDKYDVYAIPHLSGARISDEEIAIIDLNLREILENKRQSGLDIKNKLSEITRSEVDFIISELKPITTNKNYTDLFIKGLGQDNILIRINYKEKTVGVRNSKGKDFYNLKNSDFYKKYFKNIVLENKNSWVFQKQFPTHFFADSKEITNEIFNLRNEIIFMNQR